MRKSKKYHSEVDEDQQRRNTTTAPAVVTGEGDVEMSEVEQDSTAV